MGFLIETPKGILMVTPMGITMGAPRVTLVGMSMGIPVGTARSGSHVGRCKALRSHGGPWPPWVLMVLHLWVYMGPPWTSVGAWGASRALMGGARGSHGTHVCRKDKASKAKPS